MKGALAIAIAILALLPLGCGGGEQDTAPAPAAPPAPEAPASATDTRGAAPDDAIGDRPGGPRRDKVAPAGGDPFSESAGDEKAILGATVRSYLSAINRRDGFSLCQLFVAGALERVRLPKRGRGCARDVSASIGHAERGGPAWRALRVDSVGPAELDPASAGKARVRATVVTLYRGGREPSIEDDLVYLQRSGTAWLIAKPSASFHRAIGARDVPLSALVPPG